MTKHIETMRQIGVGQVLCWMNFGGLSHDRVRRSMELFAREVMPRFPVRFGLLLLPLLLLLAACAEPARMVRPPDFALHGTDHPFFDVHWRLDRNDGVVLAVGLVEAARRGGIAEVTLELQGLDKSGKVVSRSLGTTYGGPLYQGDSRPFTVRLRPTGEEARFQLRVWGFAWEFGKDGGAPSR